MSPRQPEPKLIQTTIVSDWDPMTTTHLLQMVNQKCRMFRGWENRPELDYAYDNGSGMILVHYSKGSRGNTVTLKFQRHRPDLKVV